jgi:hypothetical protein
LNENTLKAALVIALILAGGGITGAYLIMNESQAQYAALQAEFQTLTEDFTDLFNDYGNLTEDHEDLLETYGDLTESYGILTGEFDSLNQSYYALLEDYNTLSVNYDELLTEYDQLNTTYYSLLDDYNALLILYDSLYEAHSQLIAAHVELQNDYQILLASYNAITGWIKNQILPLQLSNWAEAVRQYYLQDYLDQSSDTKGWYRQYTRFCRDLVLHASHQWDPFQTVSEAFSDALLYGSDTMFLTYRAMYSMARDDGISWQTFPYRWGWSFSPENWGIDIVVQDCIVNIDYEYDDDITYGQSGATWDYPKHPVETAFRTMGDCEDQAILTAAYLERTGFYNDTGDYRFETATAIFHDPAHPTLGPFYHGTLLVHIEDTADFYSRYPLGVLWNLGGGIDPYDGYTWCWLDPTWDVPFGDVPSWLTAYRILGGLGYDVMSIAINDYNGGIAQTGNGPLEASIP